MVNAGFEIRNASADDAEMIQKITHEAFSSYVKLANIDGSIAALDESLDDIKKDIGEKIVLVAYINGEVVGSVRVAKTGDDTAYLSRFGVSPKFQNLGIGKALMNLVDINSRRKKTLSSHRFKNFVTGDFLLRQRLLCGVHKHRPWIHKGADVQGIQINTKMQTENRLFFFVRK